MVLILAGMSLVQIWWIWFRVVYSRAMIVDFYKYNMERRFDSHGNEVENNKHGNYISELCYVRNRNIRLKINKKLNICTLRATRFKIDLILPLIFSLLWGMMVFSNYFLPG